MARIDKQELGFRDRATQILLWITHAKRPLSTDELRHALAVEVGSNELDEDNLVARLDVSICAGLAIVDDKTQEVRLVHYTTQEYLEQRHFKLSWSINPHNTITEVCVTYLMYSIFKSGPCTLKDQYFERISRYSLYFYAAEHWGEHAQLCSEASELLLGLLQCKEAVGAAAQADYVGLNKYSGFFKGWVRHKSDNYAPRSAFHLAVKYGLHKAAEALPERSEDLDALYEQETPLYIALRKGDMTMARILLRKGAQVRVLGGAPVLEAFCYGTYGKTEVDESMFEDLVNNGAEIVDAEGKYHLLVTAARHGHEQLVTLLLKRGANPESLGEFRWGGGPATPLVAAVEGGHLETAMILWKSGANPNRRVGMAKWSALHEAVRIEHEQLVEMFLATESIVDLNISGDSRVDISRVEPLDYGLKAESHDLAKECISISARIAVDIESRDVQGNTPLALAAIYHRCRVAEILLSCGANIENRNNDGNTPPLVAIRGRKLDMVTMVKLLLEKGADFEARNNRGETPLLVAINTKQDDMVELLLEKGADIEVRNYRGEIPLIVAVVTKQDDMVKLLLEKGADIEARN